MDARPFIVCVPDSVLRDLKKRLELIRWPDDSPTS